MFFTNPGIFSSEAKSFAAQTYQTGGASKLESIAKVGCQSLPSNTNVILNPKIINKIEHKYSSEQRSALQRVKVIFDSLEFLLNFRLSIFLNCLGWR